MYPNIDGMFVQLPLPKHIDESKVIQKIALEKDVDGFKPEIQDCFLGNKTIKTCIIGNNGIIEKYSIELQGKDVTIIGRSNIGNYGRIL